jgi:hypothetical protein
VHYWQHRLGILSFVLGWLTGMVVYRMPQPYSGIVLAVAFFSGLLYLGRSFRGTVR